MLRTILAITIVAFGYAAFAALFRNKRCSGNCGSCVGSCHSTGEDI
jgi:hypothetical protein